MTIKALRTTRTEKQVLEQVLEAVQMLGLDLHRQNTGAAVNPRGQTVRFGTPGDSDLSGVLPDGRACMVETKAEGWNPAKARGATAERWQRQLARLQRTNDQGGCAFWTDDSMHFLEVMRHVLAGARVVEDGSINGPEIIYP